MPTAPIPNWKSWTLAQRLPALREALLRPTRRASTGWPLLDAKLRPGGCEQGGFVVPSFNVLGAGPKIGKSTWCGQLADNWAERGGVVFFWDLENGAQRWARRLMLRRTRLTEGDLNALSPGQRDEAEKWMKKAGGAHGERLIYCPDKHLTPQIAGRVLESIRAEIGADTLLLAIIDSIQKVPMDLSDQRRGAIDTWLRWCEEQRDEQQAVILAISEVGRPVVKNANYRATGTSYKESGDIEYSADLAMVMNTLPSGALRLAIEYNRDGASGKVADYVQLPNFSGFTERECEEQKKS